ncbi:MAG: tail fiber domain-containing protein [Verrucomicrobia bacterium]|nr:tail fiber domain-containing protein [Verrucomicrobiota bacterium]
MKTKTKRIGMLAMAAFVLGQADVTQAADANPPERMTYQGYLVDGNGGPLGNSAPTNYDIVFRIYPAKEGGTALWAEQQTVTVDKGYFSVLLGEGSQYGSENHNALSGAFDGTDVSDRFIGITVTGTDGDVEIAPRLKLVTSPYAFTATQARKVSDGSGNANFYKEGTDLKLGAGSTPTLTLPEAGGGTLAGKFTANLAGNGIGLQIDNGALSTTFGAENSSVFHFQTELPGFYFNKQLIVNGEIQAHNRDLVLLPSNNTDTYLQVYDDTDKITAQADEFRVQGDSKYLKTVFTSNAVELRTDASEVYFDKPLSVTSANFTGDVSIQKPDNAEAVLSLHGASQGTGRIFVGQDSNYGGGMIYNGDGTPAFAGGSTDRISFYRTSAGIHSEVFNYSYNSDDVTFNGWLGRSAHNNGALMGAYNNVGANGLKTNPIYIIGSNYKPNETTLGSMYGIGYTDGGASFITGNASGWGFYVAADGDARTFLSGSSGTKSYINRDGGQVGIGTDSPSSPLHINSTQVMYGNIAMMRLTGSGSYWDITIDNEGGTGDDDLVFYYNGVQKGWMDPDGAWKASSDRRLKKNIKPIRKGALDGIGLVPLYTYNMKSDPDERRLQVGVMAQDVQKVFPLVVDEENDWLGLDYGRLALMAFPAIVELKEEKDAEVQALRAENESLKTTVQALADEVEALKGRLVANKSTEGRLAKLEALVAKTVSGGQ